MVTNAPAGALTVTVTLRPTLVIAVICGAESMLDRESTVGTVVGTVVGGVTGVAVAGTVVGGVTGVSVVGTVVVGTVVGGVTGVALAGATKRENNNRFGDPAPSDVTTSGVAVVFNTVVTAAGVNEFCVPKSTAATPAT